VNKNSYWVISNLINGEWKELPTVSPAQMMVSRRIKYLFSGNLDKQIYTNPFFHGKESHLLKCQIVRINHACTIVPRTMYNVNPDDKK
jgi:radial spoke head protein 4A